ncbi:MAG: hypothetical protein FWF94_01575 [Oscillospiraceae bacterium]|nr:hypothetical protein [Oscillospiraceae bacterium]
MKNTKKRIVSIFIIVLMFINVLTTVGAEPPKEVEPDYPPIEPGEAAVEIRLMARDNINWQKHNTLMSESVTLTRDESEIHTVTIENMNLTQVVSLALMSAEANYCDGCNSGRDDCGFEYAPKLPHSMYEDDIKVHSVVANGDIPLIDAPFETWLSGEDHPFYTGVYPNAELWNGWYNDCQYLTNVDVIPSTGTNGDAFALKGTPRPTITSIEVTFSIVTYDFCWFCHEWGDNCVCCKGCGVCERCLFERCCYYCCMGYDDCTGFCGERLVCCQYCNPCGVCCICTDCPGCELCFESCCYYCCEGYGRCDGYCGKCCACNPPPCDDGCCWCGKNGYWEDDDTYVYVPCGDCCQCGNYMYYDDKDNYITCGNCCWCAPRFCGKCNSCTMCNICWSVPCGCCEICGDYVCICVPTYKVSLQGGRFDRSVDITGQDAKKPINPDLIKGIRITFDIPNFKCDGKHLYWGDNLGGCMGMLVVTNLNSEVDFFCYSKKKSITYRFNNEKIEELYVALVSVFKGNDGTVLVEVLGENDVVLKPGQQELQKTEPKPKPKPKLCDKCKKEPCVCGVVVNDYCNKREGKKPCLLYACGICNPNKAWLRLGNIRGTGEIEIFDALEILLYLVKMDGNIIEHGNESVTAAQAKKAAIISAEGFKAGEPTIFCFIEILLYLTKFAETGSIEGDNIAPLY